MKKVDARGIRLELEYLKAEALMRKHRVRHTILVMGSTRAARTDPYYGIAREFGRMVGRARGVALMTGGGPGIMEAANRGALEAGGLSIGLNIDLPVPQRANRYCSPGLSLHFRYFALRKLHFMLRARAMVAFPGGFGTFDELFETLMLAQTRKIKPMPIVLVGEAWWRRAVDFDFLLAEGKIAAGDKRLYRYAENAREIWEAVAQVTRAPAAPARGSGAPPARRRCPGPRAAGRGGRACRAR